VTPANTHNGDGDPFLHLVSSLQVHAHDVFDDYREIRQAEKNPQVDENSVDVEPRTPFEFFVRDT
jgi:hypothetical protein